jgi:RNA polymerase sigma-B factor
LDDIVQVGFLGLIKAIDRFDLELGNEFSTFATPTIAGEIKRYFRDKSWAIKVPRRLQELNQRVLRANDELRAELNRQPAVAEVAARLEVSPDEILEAMEMGETQIPLSMDVAVGGDEARPLADSLGDADPDLARVEMRDVLERAMRHLTPRERSIMAMRFYDQLSQAEIAKRLGISQMHVSRLQRAALEQLKTHIPESAQ